MNIAREFSRPDWRAMLAGLTSTELNEWADYFNEHFYLDAQLDAHFSSLNHLLLSIAYPKHNKTIADFSLLNLIRDVDSRSEIKKVMSDDEMMQAAEGISGGLRFEPESG